MVKFLGAQRSLALLNASIILFVSLFSLVTPVMFKLLIESVLPDGNWRAFWLTAAVLAAITIGRTVFGVLQDYVFLLHRQLLEVAALEAALRRDDLKTMNTADGFAGIRNFVANFQYFWIQFAFYIAYAIFISALVLVAFYLIEPAYCWLSVGFMLLHVVNFSLFRPLVEGAALSFTDGKAGLIAEVGTHLKLLPEARAARREAFLERRVAGFSAEYAHTYERKEFINLLQEMVQNSVINVFYIIFFCLALYLSISRDVSIGSAALCTFLAGFLFEPIFRFSSIAKAFFEATGYTQWVPRQLQPRTTGAAEAGSLRLRGVVTQPMLERGLPPLDVDFAPGRLHLIRGPSGCGKSTLLDCIAGIDKPLHGEILGDHGPLQRGAVYYCEQEAALFPGDLLQNLCFYDEQPRHGEAESLLRASGLSTLPPRQEVEALSGGQKQRLALVRALYNAQGVLLFDEPTSALDAANEATIFRLLTETARSRVVIVVSHSGAAAAYAGQIIDLGGRGVDQAMPEVERSGEIAGAAVAIA